MRSPPPPHSNLEALPRAETLVGDEPQPAAPTGSAVEDQLARFFPETSPMRAVLERMFGDDLEGRDLSREDIDHLIADIDQRITAQLDEILHAPELQAVESRWRSLEYMVDNVDFEQNTKLEIFNVKKDELLEDFEDQLEVTRSTMYDVIYKREFGVAGGHPYGLCVLDYDFGPGRDDIELLSRCASVGSMAHCVVIGNASPKMLELDSFTELSELHQVPGVLKQASLARYNRLRETVDSRYLGLCLPRFLLRRPYQQNMLQPSEIVYSEDTTQGPHQFTWGHASAAFAVCVAQSFAKYRWCPNIIGPDSGGLVGGFVDIGYDALRGVQKVPLEIAITPDLENELSQVGLVSLSARRGTGEGVFLSASSVQTAGDPHVVQRSVDTLDQQLGAQLPYLFIITRIAHYLKVWQRSHIGSTVTAHDMEQMLQRWLKENLVSDMEAPGPDLRRRRPLRAVKLAVEDVPGEVGWYRYTIEIQPHFRYLNADFRLSLVGRLER